MKKPKKNIFEKPPEEIFEDLEDLQMEDGVEDAAGEHPEGEASVEVLDSPPAVSDMEDKYRRVLAEFDNFRKRTAKEMAARYDDGTRAACEKLLPIADNFERALATHPAKDDPFYKGIEMIARQFEAMLDELGIKEIPADPGTPFDTNHHYAVAHIEDENLEENTVAEVLQKGYIHRERVIRPVMVKVAN